MSDWSIERDREIVRLARAGMPRQEIAEQLQVSRWMVFDALRHAGMTRMRHRAPYTAEGDRRILYLYRQGLRTRDIAIRTNCDLAHIRYVARQAGILERGRSRIRVVTEDIRQAMVEDYVQGLSSIAIAQKYGISDTCARRHLHRAGVTLRYPWTVWQENRRTKRSTK